MILPCGKNIDIIPNFRLEAQVDAATKSGSHDFHFTVHFCNSAVFQRGEVAALICIREVTTTVGYNTINISKQYTLLTVNFDKVDGGAIDIQDAFPYGTGMTKGLSISDGDNIQIMTSDGGYDTYFLSNGHYGKGGASYDEALDGKWSAPGTNAATTDKFPSGKGAFYLSRSKEGSVKFVSPIK